MAYGECFVDSFLIIFCRRI